MVNPGLGEGAVPLVLVSSSFRIEWHAVFTEDWVEIEKFRQEVMEGFLSL